MKPISSQYVHGRTEPENNGGGRAEPALGPEPSPDAQTCLSFGVPVCGVNMETLIPLSWGCYGGNKILLKAHIAPDTE